MTRNVSALALAAFIGLGGLAAVAEEAPKPAAQAAPAAAPAPDSRKLAAKITYCKTCHGLSGQGFKGDVPIPRLAGQPVEYFENQVHAFIERRRNNPIMYNVAHGMPPEMLRAVAEHFHSLSPPPLGGGQHSLVDAGKKIYDEGVPGSEIPPCASCHGPEAKGDGQFPRLAGQLPDYVLRKLTNFSKERGQDPNNPDTSAIMAPIAHGLSEQQVRAVAAYLSGLN